MKIQDHFPYHSTILGLEDLYIDFKNGDFYVNIPCINVHDKTITTGKTYSLLKFDKNTYHRIIIVELVDVFYMEDLNVFCFLVEDLKTKKRMMPIYYLETGEQKPFQWCLSEIEDDIMKAIEDEIVRQYCGCEEELQSKDEDLLELDW